MKRLTRASLPAWLLAGILVPAIVLGGETTNDIESTKNTADRVMLQVLSGEPADAADLRLLGVESVESNDSNLIARSVGETRARVQWRAAENMIAAIEDGDTRAALAWRALVDVPRHGSSVEGGIALIRGSKQSFQRRELISLLSREVMMWQVMRLREKLDDLDMLLGKGKPDEALFVSRVAEIVTLQEFSPVILRGGEVNLPSKNLPAVGAGENHAGLLDDPETFASWKNSVLHSLPNLLDEQEIARRERLLAKLIALVPIEYRSGVRDGQIVIPIEFREAVSFTRQAKQIYAELVLAWAENSGDGGALIQTQSREILGALDSMAQTIASKDDVPKVADHSKQILAKLEDFHGISLKRSGKASEIVAESALEVRSLLGQSLAAALAGKWRQAESLRLEAYTTFDLEIERRLLPRDPDLALRAERQFLDGDKSAEGIKASLDRRAPEDRLHAAYEGALGYLQEAESVLKMGLSPATVSFTSFTIVLREGMEAVVILSALLAGFRGDENRPIRRKLAAGAWLALAASVLTFYIGNILISSLSRYGEILEAVRETGVPIPPPAEALRWISDLGWQAEVDAPDDKHPGDGRFIKGYARTRHHGRLTAKCRQRHGGQRHDLQRDVEVERVRRQKQRVQPR